MSQSLTNILVHIIFSTKDRQSLINQSVEDQLHAYMVAVFKEYDSPALIIGGTENHVHILCSLSEKYSLSKILEDVKKYSPYYITLSGFNSATFLFPGRCPGLSYHSPVRAVG